MLLLLLPQCSKHIFHGWLSLMVFIFNDWFSEKVVITFQVPSRCFLLWILCTLLTVFTTLLETKRTNICPWKKILKISRKFSEDSKKEYVMKVIIFYNKLIENKNILKKIQEYYEWWLLILVQTTRPLLGLENLQTPSTKAIKCIL